jgi:hypothetical protein
LASPIKPFGSSKFVASAAMCAALYAIFDALTSTLRTPWGVGEFRPGIVIPVFFALVAGPLPAALGAGVGSFIADMVSLVPSGASTPALAAVAGAPANFLGILLVGWIYQKFRTWRGFIGGTTVGLFFGNLWAAGFVVWLLGLSSSLILGLLLFWFGTMFPFVVILVPPMLRYLRPYASKLSSRLDYPVIIEPNWKLLWIWSVTIAVLVLAAMGALLVFQAGLVKNSPGAVLNLGFAQISLSGAQAWELLFGVSAISVLLVGAFIPRTAIKQSSSQQKVAPAKT